MSISLRVSFAPHLLLHATFRRNSIGRRCRVFTIRICSYQAMASAEAKTTQPQTLDSKESHYMKLLSRSCKAGKFNESLYFLEYMVGKGYKLDVILCTKLIKGLCSSRSVDKAVRVMDILESHGEPDVFAYNALVSGFCKAGRIESAIEVLGRMKSRRCPPDIVTYNILIGCFCTRGKLDLALEALDRLLDDKCQPTVVTFTILIEAALLQGGIGDAMKFLDEMMSQGLQPDNYTYTAIIRGLCREGMVDAAYEFLKSLPSRECDPDVMSYNVLLRGLLSYKRWEDGEKVVGKLDRAKQLLDDMISRGLKPDSYSYDPLISAYYKAQWEILRSVLCENYIVIELVFMNVFAVLARGIECDIALLAVESEEFWKGAEPLRFGQLPCLQESINCISFSNKSSRYLCSGGSGHIVRIWDLQRKRCIKRLSGHIDTITGVMYNCKDEHLASINEKGDLILHYLASGTRAELKDPNGQVLRVLDYSRFSRHLLSTAGDDGSVHIWDTTGRRPKIIVTVGLDKKLYMFDSGTKRPSYCMPFEALFSLLAYCDDGNLLAAGTNNGRVVFYDVRGKPQPFTVLRAYSSSEFTNLKYSRVEIDEVRFEWAECMLDYI
ncbi:hypothetical protein ZIOFF_005889 [Zingiber officinale]|uniref:Pentatricopeptide repeat-containing protein n=1 Tax=Zingiber officinale TaxID=94328 RepID=A0A8J5IBK7_ZINOF|nr:hypothetical protein ZIOFF_005889 [Zingiber officinale]